MEKGAIFPLFYLPPVEYFSKLVVHKSEIVIEKHEHFPKQTYRNRASVYSPNGKLDLIVPVVRGFKVHKPIRDARISYEFNWQRIHWMSLQTSYRSSAFFEYYEDDFATFFEKRYDYLFDFNEQILQLLIRLLKLKISYSTTDTYNSESGALFDYRNAITPKQISGYSAKTYYQVFEEKYGFISNLSIVDLLFNQGPQANNHL